MRYNRVFITRTCFPDVLEEVLLHKQNIPRCDAAECGITSGTLFFFFFFGIGALRPSQQIFSHFRTEPTLPGFNPYFRELMCLAQGHNMVPSVGIEPGPLDSMTDALPLCHRAPYYLSGILGIYVYLFI